MWMKEEDAFRRLEENCSYGHGNTVRKRRDCMTCQVMLLREVAEDARQAAYGDADEVDEYKDASGLMAGGDPGGVTPAILREHQGMASDVILAAKAFLDARADDNDSFAALRDAVTDYFKKWPEQ